jgi:hypothetical protein
MRVFAVAGAGEIAESGMDLFQREILFECRISMILKERRNDYLPGVLEACF